MEDIEMKDETKSFNIFDKNLIQSNINAINSRDN